MERILLKRTRLERLIITFHTHQLWMSYDLFRNLKKFSISRKIWKVEIVFLDQSVRGKGVKCVRGGRGQSGVATGLTADMEGSIRKLGPAHFSV